ncbi:MAG: hypothetical protein Q9182_007062 [Xanthomendoza sp. 2 TL-2023]
MGLCQRSRNIVVRFFNIKFAHDIFMTILNGWEWRFDAAAGKKMVLKNKKQTPRIKALRTELPQPPKEHHQVDLGLNILVRVDDRGAIAALAELSGPAILGRIREAIHEAHWWFLNDDCVGWVIAAKQLPTGDVEVVADDLEHHDTLKTHSAWQTAFMERLTRETYTYGITVVGLEVSQLPKFGGEDLQSALIQQLFRWNVSRISSLHHHNCILSVEIRPTNHGKPIYIVNLTLPGIANELISKGIQWNSTWYPCKKYIREWSLFQCSECFLFGHTSTICTEEVRCVNCAHAHPESQCQSRDRKCVNCGGPHRSTAPFCPQRENEARSRRELKERPANAGRFWPITERKRDPADRTLGVDPAAPSNSKQRSQTKTQTKSVIHHLNLPPIIPPKPNPVPISTTPEPILDILTPPPAPSHPPLSSTDEQSKTDEQYTPSILPPLIRRFGDRAAR